MRLSLKPPGKGPLAAAAVLATPMFFSSLLAFSLALESPGTQTTVKGGKAVTTEVVAQGWAEWRMWVLALVPSLAVVLVGYTASFFRPLGIYAALGFGIAAAYISTYDLSSWADGHVRRYPFGVDLVPPSNGLDDKILRGQWEGDALHTIDQTRWATVGLALAIFLVVAGGELQRRRIARVPVEPPPPDRVGSRAGF